jgi:hypothetical protein
VRLRDAITPWRTAALLACLLTLGWVLLGALHPPHQRAVPGHPLAALTTAPAGTTPTTLTPIISSGHVPKGWMAFLAAGSRGKPGAAETPWYPSPRRDHVATLVATTFRAWPLTLSVERQDASGTVTTQALTLPSSGAPWYPVSVPLSRNTVRFRLVATADANGLIRFSVPYAAAVDVVGGGLALVEIGLTTVAVLTLLFGPGIALAVRRGRVNVLTVALPGFAIMVGIGVIAWVSGVWTRPAAFPTVRVPSRVATLLVVAVTLALLIQALLAHRGPRVPRHAGVVLAIFGLVFIAAVARGTWSASTPGELYGGSVSRVLENGNRPDARTSYLTAAVELAGLQPFSAPSNHLFTPYSFGDRGPLPGLAAVPIIAASGGRPTGQLGQPWQPMDPYGYAAYRIMQEALNLLALLGIAGLASRLGGARAGVIAAILAGLTPFILHETYYTWPKLLATFFIMLAAAQIVRRRPLTAGTALAAGYLCHPLAALWGPPLALFLIWRECRHRRAQTSSPAFTTVLIRQLIGSSVRLAAIPVAIAVGWNRFNEHYKPGHDPFLQYPLQVNAHAVHTIHAWLVGRAEEIATTLAPGVSVYWKSAQAEIHTIGGPSTWATRWSLQYWTTMPFAFGVLGLPLLGVALHIAFRRFSVVSIIGVVVPFLVFIAYWGSFISGSMREGLHPWLATLLVVAAVVAARQWNRTGVKILVTVAAGRVIEIVAMLIGAMLVEGWPLTTRQFLVTDVASMIAVGVCLAALTVAAIRVRTVLEWCESSGRRRPVQVRARRLARDAPT